MEDIRSMNVRNWKKVAQDRDSWKKAVEQARTLQVVVLYKKKRLYWSHVAQDRTNGVNKVIKYEFHKWLRSYRRLCPKKDFS